MRVWNVSLCPLTVPQFCRMMQFKKGYALSCDTRGFCCSENSWGYRQTVHSADSSISHSEDRLPDAVTNLCPPGIRDPIRCIERSLTCFPALAEVGQTSFFLSSVWNRAGCALNMNQELDFMFVKVSTGTNILLLVLSICHFSIHCDSYFSVGDQFFCLFVFWDSI